MEVKRDSYLYKLNSMVLVDLYLLLVSRMINGLIIQQGHKEIQEYTQMLLLVKSFSFQLIGIFLSILNQLKIIQIKLLNQITVYSKLELGSKKQSVNTIKCIFNLHTYHTCHFSCSLNRLAYRIQNKKCVLSHVHKMLHNQNAHVRTTQMLQNAKIKMLLVKQITHKPDVLLIVKQTQAKTSVYFPVKKIKIKINVNAALIQEHLDAFVDQTKSETGKVIVLI